MGTTYAGVSGIATKIDSIHVGVEGVARQVKKVYAGDANGIARLVFIHDWIIPVQYQQVLYIESSGTQYIDTGVNPTGYNSTNNIRSYIKLALTSVSGEQCPWGVRNTSGNTYLCIGHSSSTWYLGSGSVTHASTGATVDTIYELDAYFASGTQTLTVGDSSTPSISRTDSTARLYTRNAYLFASNASQGGAYRRLASMRMYNAKCWVNGTLQYNYYPCYEKSSGTVGVYDIVNGEFLTNAGTGTFSAGPDNVEPL